jgi:hypothetical protein
MNAQAQLETARIDLIEKLAEKLIPARERLEEARRALHAARAVSRDHRASQAEKQKAQAAQAEAQRDLTTATAECSRLERESEQARTGTHPELARAVVAAQHEHQQQRAQAIAKAEGALRSALLEDAVQAPLAELAGILGLGRSAALQHAVNLLKG